MRAYWKSLIKRWWLALFPVLAIVSFYAAKHTTIELKAFAQVQATPFVLETYSYSFSQNPSGDLLEKRVTARRSDGSTAEVFTMGPHLLLSARTMTFMSGARLNVLDFVSLTKWNTKPSELAALKDRLTNAPPDCLFRPFKLIRYDKLLGEHVVMVQAVYPQQVGRDYLWLAPRLGCESMKFRFETPQPDGSYKLVAESKPVSLTLGEPDPRFFFDPASHYSEPRANP